MPGGISEPIEGLDDFIETEPDSVEEVRRSRKDQLQEFLVNLKTMIAEKNKLTSARAAFYLALIYLNCPNTCDYDPVEIDRKRMAIEYLIVAVLIANYDPYTVSIPAFKLSNYEVIGPGCRLNHDAYVYFEPINDRLLAELELSQIYIKSIILIDEVYRNLSYEEKASDFLNDLLARLKPLLIDAQSKYLSAPPYTPSLIKLLKTYADNIFSAVGIKTQHDRLPNLQCATVKSIQAEDQFATPGVYRRKIFLQHQPDQKLECSKKMDSHESKENVISHNGHYSIFGRISSILGF